MAKDVLPEFIINKTENGLIKVSISEFKGKFSLDIRHYYLDKGDGEFKPSPRGCGIPVSMSKKFVIRLKKLVLEAEAQGFEILEN